jgi:hypothetical protein
MGKSVSTKSNNSVTPVLPDDLFTFAKLKTLAGAAAAVWVLIAVVHTVLPKDALHYTIWRIIALCLSEIVALIILFEKKNRRTKDWFIAILNGCLIFINASGLNAVSNGTSFFTKDETVKSPHLTVTKSSILPFLDDVSWWPDTKLLRKIKEQKIQPYPIPISDTMVSRIYLDSLLNTITTCDSLKILQKIEGGKSIIVAANPKTDLQILKSWLDSSRTCFNAYVHNKNYAFKYAKRLREINTTILFLLKNPSKYIIKDINKYDITSLQEHYKDWIHSYDSVYKKNITLTPIINPETKFILGNHIKFPQVVAKKIGAVIAELK